MTIIYSINVVLFLVSSFVCTVLIRSKFNLGLFSVPTFIFLTTVPLTFLKRLSPVFIGQIDINDSGYQFAILMDNLFYLIVLIKTVVILRNFNWIEKWILRFFKALPIDYVGILKVRTYLNPIFVISLTGYMSTFWLLTNTNTNLIDWLLNPRDGYQRFRVGAGHWYALAIIFLGINTVFVFFYRRVSFAAFVILAVCYSFLWYLFGGKAYIVQLYMLLIMAAFVNYGYKVSRYLFGFALFLSAVVVLLINFSNFDNSSDRDGIESILRYFDHYIYGAMYYNDFFSGGIDLFYGEIQITKMIVYIPRWLFPEKPFVYGPILVNEIYLPGMAEAGHTPEFAGQVPYFADFGVLGVIFYNIIDFQFIFGFVSLCIALKNYAFLRIDSASVLAVFYVYSFAPAFSQFIFFPFDIFGLIAFMLLVSYARRFVFTTVPFK